MSARGFSLTPHDVLFFRDGRPSSRGTDHFLRSLFPPFPSTLYGAVRTRRLLDRDIDLDDVAGLRELGDRAKTVWRERLGDLVAELGEWGSTGSLALRGPWLVREGEPLVPAPADLGLALEAPAEPGGEPRVAAVLRLRPEEGAAGGWSHPLAPLVPWQRDGEDWRPWRGADPSPPTGRFLRPAGLAAWRRGGVPAPEDLVRQDDLWLSEARSGLGFEDDVRRGRDGELYTFGFVRLRPGVAIGFEAAHTKLEPHGAVRLGGDGRTAALGAGPTLPAATWPAGRRVAVSLVTPAVAAAGGWPPGFGPDRLAGELGGRHVRLVAAAVPGFVLTGGWDLAKHFPKTMRRALPAGSTFLFERLDEDGGHGEEGQEIPPLSDVDDLGRQGFGTIVAGAST